MQLKWLGLGKVGSIGVMVKIAAICKLAQKHITKLLDGRKV